MSARVYKKLSTEQKISFVLLLIFAFLGLGLGVLKIRNTMYKPFALTNAIPYGIRTLADNISNLQYRDTDFDGLNDFEELYVYSTSPYLDDTDSDGIKDKDEIQKGTSPTCATGKICSGKIVTNSGVPIRTTSTITNVLPPTGPAPVDVTKMLQDPKLLRSALLSSGMDKKILNKVTDDQLMSIVKEAFPTTSSLQSINNLLPTNQ